MPCNATRFGEQWTEFLRHGAVGVVCLCAATAGAAAPYGLNSRVTIGAFLNGAFPSATPQSSAWQAVAAFPNLVIADPTGLLPVPGTNLLCVHSRQGQIYFFPNDPATTNKVLVLDIGARVQAWD